jgi:hypothetical protein
MNPSTKESVFPVRARRAVCFPWAGMLVLVALLAGCSARNEAEDQPIARVEDQTISLSELKASTNLNIMSSGESAEDWINEAVLAYHAGRSDYFLGNALGKRLLSYQQRLLTNLYLDSLLSRRVFVHPETARAYYANNLDTYQFRDDAVIALLFGFRHIETAEAALAQLASSPANRDSILSIYHYDRQLVYRGQLLPLLEEAIFSATLNTFAGPVKSDFGYHIFTVERFFKQGDTVPYAFVRKYIYEKLLQRQLPLAKMAVLDSLREVTDIDIQN